MTYKPKYKKHQAADQVRKLRALLMDSAASDNEKEFCERRIKELIQEYQLTDEDVDSLSVRYPGMLEIKFPFKFRHTPLLAMNLVSFFPVVVGIGSEHLMLVGKKGAIRRLSKVMKAIINQCHQEVSDYYFQKQERVKLGERYDSFTFNGYVIKGRGNPSVFSNRPFPKQDSSEWFNIELIWMSGFCQGLVQRIAALKMQKDMEENAAKHSEETKADPVSGFISHSKSQLPALTEAQEREEINSYITEKYQEEVQKTEDMHSRKSNASNKIRVQADPEDVHAGYMFSLRVDLPSIYD